MRYDFFSLCVVDNDFYLSLCTCNRFPIQISSSYVRILGQGIKLTFELTTTSSYMTIKMVPFQFFSRHALLHIVCCITW